MPSTVALQAIETPLKLTQTAALLEVIVIIKWPYAYVNLAKSHATLAGGAQCSWGCQSSCHDNRCSAADVTGFAALHLRHDLVKTLCNILTFAA